MKNQKKIKGNQKACAAFYIQFKSRLCMSVDIHTSNLKIKNLSNYSNNICFETVLLS